MLLPVFFVAAIGSAGIQSAAVSARKSLAGVKRAPSDKSTAPSHHRGLDHCSTPDRTILLYIPGSAPRSKKLFATYAWRV